MSPDRAPGLSQLLSSLPNRHASFPVRALASAVPSARNALPPTRHLPLPSLSSTPVPRQPAPKQQSRGSAHNPRGHDPRDHDPLQGLFSFQFPLFLGFALLPWDRAQGGEQI